jgi:hypothetical protein
MSLKDPALREKYLADVDWSETVPYFSHSFGVSLAVGLAQVDLSQF